MDEKQRKRIQHYKELKALKKKMKGFNLLWFNSLNLRRQYDFLFDWKREKNFNTTKEVTIAYVRMRGWRIIITHKYYPPSLKHFIKASMRRRKYYVNHADIRNTALGVVLDEIKIK